MKYSKGPWSFSPMRGQIGHCTMAQVWDDEGNNLCSIDSRYGEDKASANAELIAKTPEMYSILERIFKESKDLTLDVSGQQLKLIPLDLFDEIEKLINKADFYSSLNNFKQDI